MRDSQLAASVLALLDGTEDTFLVCAGAGAVVAQKTAGQVLTLLNVYTVTQTDTAIATAVAAVDLSAKVSKSGDTMTGALTISVNGAVSAPGEKLTGTWYTGGSATTTKPYALIEPAGTTSTNWSTSGTGIGANAASGFAGNLLDLQVSATRKMSVSSTGTIRTSGGDLPSNGGIGATGLAVEIIYSGYGLGVNGNGETTVVVGSLQVVRLGLLTTVGSAGGFAISNGTQANQNATADVKWTRNATGPKFSANADGGLEVRNFAKSADAPLTCSSITLSGAANLAPLTKAALLALTPTAATAGRWRVTDATPASREAYPDGTNWRYTSDDTVVT